jgi:hypothetical protein
MSAQALTSLRIDLEASNLVRSLKIPVDCAPEMCEPREHVKAVIADVEARLAVLLPPGAQFDVPGQEELQAQPLERLIHFAWAAGFLKDRPAKRLAVTEATGVLLLRLVTPRATVPAAPAQEGSKTRKKNKKHEDQIQIEVRNRLR